jgi:ribosomal-protein-alanine N-acetyltransferase
MSGMKTPVINTKRLILRPLSYNDAGEVFLLRSNEEIHRYLLRPLAKTIEDARAFIERINEGNAKGEILYWGAQLKGESRIIGTVCLWKINLTKLRAETGYELMPAFQGKGYAAEALAAALDYGFNSIKLSAIEAEVSPENERSISLLKKFNFVLPGKTPEQVVEEGGATVIYELNSEKFRS